MASLSLEILFFFSYGVWQVNFLQIYYSLLMNRWINYSVGRISFLKLLSHSFLLRLASYQMEYEKTLPDFMRLRYIRLLVNTGPYIQLEKWLNLLPYRTNCSCHNHTFYLLNTQPLEYFEIRSHRICIYFLLIFSLGKDLFEIFGCIMKSSPPWVLRAQAFLSEVG